MVPDAYKIASQDEGFNRFWKWVCSNRQGAQERMREPAALSPVQAVLVAHIRAAFAGLRVGEDTLLYLSSEADDPGWNIMDAASLAQLRRLEVRDAWEQIPPDLLSCCNDGFTYMSAEGMRYLLPALMVTSLQHPELEPDLLSIVLTESRDSTRLLALLNEEQRDCVSDFVNQKRLAEVHQGCGLIDWDGLLPWEEQERQSSAPTREPSRYAEDMLLRYCGKHGVSL